MSSQKQLKILDLKRKLERMERDIKKVIETLDKYSEDTRPRCARCGWSNMNVRQDKTYLCKSCGHDSRSEK